MAATETATLELAPRAPEGSRSARRLRREGKVPGILYGAGDEPRSFMVDARILRNALAHAHAVIEVSLGGGALIPAMVKDVQRHPVRGEMMHVDLLRVRLDEKIQTTVILSLEGADVAPGVKEGGILTQEHIQLNVEALPGDIPDEISFDVSGLQMNATLTVADLEPPAGVELLDGPETVLATVTPPTVERTEDEVDLETQLVGDEGVASAKAGGDTAQEAQQSAEGSSGAS
jgi:large subunit ribosomal protein L25